MQENISKEFFKRLDADGIEYVKANSPSGRIVKLEGEHIKERIYTVHSIKLKVYSPSDENIPWEQLIHEIKNYHIIEKIPIFYQLLTYIFYQPSEYTRIRTYTLRCHKGFEIDIAQFKKYTIYGKLC